ncbi:PspA/IM30 family protein [Nocardia jiangsuensis]|uniref:PspA/IM30 family protein n=1 Tax=Nocardia jiangsuensis TaxID=1691563 RepID=A0ABV8E2Q8_9NOCA
MTDSAGIAALLAALPDDELLAVLRSATAQRPSFARVYAALTEQATSGGPLDTVVIPDTPQPGAGAVPQQPPRSQQVGGGFAVPPVPVPPQGMSGTPPTGGYTASGVPTFDSVRDKVEQRFGTAQGREELERETSVQRSVEEQWQAREDAARDRLDKIRKSMRDEPSGP